MESKTLQMQAKNNTKEQLRSSPDLLLNSQNAYMDAFEAHKSMSSQALNDSNIQHKILDLLIDKWDLWEELKEKAEASAT